MAILSTLHEMVSQKQAFAEAAKYILEDTITLDDAIILEAGDDDKLPEGTKDPLENDNTQEQPEGETPMSVGDDNTDSNDNDIMNAELDISNDTISNVNPSAPDGAADQIETPESPNGGNALSSDLMNEPIDMDDDSSDTTDEDQEKETEISDDDMKSDDMGNDDEEIMNEVISDEQDSETEIDDSDFNDEELDFDNGDNDDEGISESFINDFFSEAITVDDGSTAAPPAADGTDQTDSSAAPDMQNDVTSAVKDKVAEADASVENIEPMEAEPPISDIPADTASDNTEKRAALAKKVASLNKQIADLAADVASQ